MIAARNTPNAIKILLPERLKLHPSCCEPLQIIEFLGYPFPAKAVQTPEEHDIETTLVGIYE